MADKITTRPATPEYRDGHDRIFGKALDRSMRPTPGSETERREEAGEYTHVTYPSSDRIFADILNRAFNKSEFAEQYQQYPIAVKP